MQMTWNLKWPAESLLEYCTRSQENVERARSSKEFGEKVLELLGGCSQSCNSTWALTNFVSEKILFDHLSIKCSRQLEGYGLMMGKVKMRMVSIDARDIQALATLTCGKRLSPVALKVTVRTTLKAVARNFEFICSVIPKCKELCIYIEDDHTDGDGGTAQLYSEKHRLPSGLESLFIVYIGGDSSPPRLRTGKITFKGLKVVALQNIRIGKDWLTENIDHHLKQLSLHGTGLSQNVGLVVLQRAKAESALLTVTDGVQ